MKRKNAADTPYPEFEQLDMCGIEKEILEWWKEQKVFQRSIRERPAEKQFVFYEGPPSANGKPGIHHVMSRTIKDLFCRFKTLQGFRVERKAGWDTHGLPVELNVEKNLGIKKSDIGTKISVAEFNRLCREDVMRYTDVWNELTEKMGYWVDLDKPYVTYSNEYIETLWVLIKMLYEKGLLYEGYTIQPYSPAAGTGLSSHELNQPGCYRAVKDVSAVVQFKVIRDANSDFLFLNATDDVRFLAWTTTPWTLPSNTALAVGKDIDYVLVKTFNPYSYQPVQVILARDLMAKYFPEKHAELALEDYSEGDKKIPYKVVKTFTGSQLEGIRYEQLLPYAQPKDGDAFRVVVGDFVTTTDGTGIVHIAPSFGADDFKLAKQNHIGSLTLVDKNGRFVEEVNDPIFPLAGRYVKESYYNDEEKQREFEHQKQVLKAHQIISDLKSFLSVDDLIVLKLKLENKLFKTEKYEHNYPHCWRTDKPVIYYPLHSWFIKTTAIKDKLIAWNKTIQWKPAHTGEGRFGQWLENLVDWNLSRSRFWGTPLPIWKTTPSSEDSCEVKCIGTIAELKQEVEKSVAAGFMQPIDWSKLDLHKPLVDEIILVSNSGKPMYRVPDLMDVWFDSGAMPYAQHHWLGDLTSPPFGTSCHFPADFIAEGVDQTRGWFFTLHVLAVALFDSVAFKTVVSNGLLLDKNGNKMSKRLGNVIDPFETIEKYSADATRWYMIRNSDPWDNMKFDIAGLQEVQRSFFGTLYNTYAFFALYANIDRPLNPVARKPNLSNPHLIELDKWILSKLYSLSKEVTAYYEDYEPTKAARAIEKFMDDDLSNWYVRLNRRRFWKGEMSEDKQAAYDTLFHCLIVVSQLMSPIAPFFSDWLFRNLTSKNQSVHLSLLEPADETFINKELEARMELAQKSCSLILSLRKKEKIKVRQPLSKVLIPVLNAEQKEQFQKVENYILSEVNVKAIDYISDAQGMLKKKIKLNFKELGKRAGPKIKAIQNAVAAFGQEEINALELHKKYELNVNNETFELLLTDVEIFTEDIPGWLVVSHDGLTVALDITITDDLRKEGNAREFVNKVQNLRKDKSFQVLDRIKVIVEKNAVFEESLTKFKDYISREVLATDISIVDSLDGADEIEMNDETLKVKLERA